LVFSANFHENRVNTYLLTGFGLIEHQTIQYEVGAKAHFIDYHPATDEVYVCLYGLAQVLIYGISKRHELILKHTYQATPLSGPRHLVVHPSLPYVYVLAEAIGELLVLERVEDTLVLRQNLSTLPVGEDEIKSASAIRFGKDAIFIYVSNRGHDSISVFQIMENGLCEMIQNITTLGKNPRDFNISPNGQVIIIANQDSDTIVSYKIDLQSGKLIKHLNTVEAYEPSCIVFQKEK
jgi:6-phosphogluconolactonase